jgi:hypothetical protein
MASAGKYIYCFVKEKEEVSICSSSFANVISPVYTLPYKDISAVVSNTDVYEFDPTRKNVLNHQRVMSKIMERYPIIPVAFGTVGNNKKDIENIITTNYDQLLDKLEFFKDKSELGLRITWDNNYFNEDIESDEIKVLKRKVTGKEEDEVLIEKIQLGRLVQEAIENKKEEYIKEIYKPLSKLAVMSKQKDGIPIKTVFNAYFLIHNSESDKFDKMVEKISEPFLGKLVFSYTGPWPPYNFVDLRLNVNTEN